MSAAQEPTLILMNTSSVIFIVLSCLIAIVLTGCASTNESRGDGNEPDVITEEEIHETNAVNINDLIAKRVPGITIAQTPDGRITLRLRGRSTFTGEDVPLFVVDGFPTEPNRDGSLPGILITEIERIEVLKDPSETSRWGMRGAHGVILVTTKEGSGN